MTADEALAPVLRDAAATYPLAVRVRPMPGEPDGRWVSVRGAGAVGILPPPGAEPVDAVVHAADTVAEWLVEQLPGGGHPAVWPECPEHPRAHPMVADRARAEAVWRCPRSGTAQSAIGALART